MKKMMRVFAIILSVTLMLSTMLTAGVITSFAEDPGLVIEMEDVTGEPGDTVSVPVKITKNTGIWGFQIEIPFDPDEMTFDTFEIDSAASAVFSVYSTVQSNSNVVSIQPNGTAMENNTYTGPLGVIKFVLADDVSSGDIEVTPSWLSRNSIKSNYDEVLTDMTGAVITVHTHSYTVSYTWNAAYTQCTASAICSCNDTITENGTVTSQKVSDPTCEGKGSNKYTATFTNTLFATQTEIVQNIPATGHNYVVQGYEWATDGSSCVASAKCSKCLGVISENGSIASAITTPATCESKGKTTYTATFTNALYSTQTKTIENIDALGHEYEISYNWSNDGSSCTAVADCKNCDSHIEQNGSVTSAVETEAGCETKGKTKYTATFTNTLFATQTKTIEDIPAKGHDYELTFNWAADGSSCSGVADCKNCDSHIEQNATITSYISKAATTTSKGITTYVASFANSVFGTQTKEIENIEKLDREYAITYTWSADGSKCTAFADCGEQAYNITEDGKISSSVLVPAKCEAKGTTRYTATFTNTMFEAQTKDIEDISATGHSYEVTGYDWAADGSSCVGHAKCSGCDDVIDLTGTVSSKVKTEAGCESKGVTTYTATFSNNVFTTQTKDIEDIAAKGHNYVVTGYDWSADGSSCVGHAKCSGCDDVIDLTGTVSSKVKTEAGCENKGVTTYTATFSNDIFATQTKDIEDIPAKGHDYVIEYVWTTDGSSCTATATCKNDKTHTVTETIASTSEILIQPSQSEMGTTRYTATFTNTLFETQTKDIKDIPGYILGDVDSNGTVDMKDILMLRKKVAGQQVDMTKYNPLAADVNIDKAVDMKDVLLLRKFVAKIITEF